MFSSVRRPSGRLAAPLVALGLACTGAPVQAQTVKIAVDSPWLRETAAGQSAGGGFLIITNKGRAEDRLTGGTSPAAGEVQVHTMTLDGGIMRMRQLKDGLAIPSGRSVALKPGGLHIMLIGLKSPLKRETAVPVTLEFVRAGKVTVEFRVKPVTYDGGGHERG